jgi:hypothetical protein
MFGHLLFISLAQNPKIMSFEDTRIGKILIYQTDQAQSFYAELNAEETAIVKQLKPSLEQLIKAQNQFYISPTFENGCKSFFKSNGVGFDQSHKQLKELTIAFKAHFDEINLILDQILTIELFSIPMDDILIDALLVLIPGDPVLVLDQVDSGNSRTLKIGSSLSKPMLAILFPQTEDEDGLHIGLSTKGLLPYQIIYIKEKMLAVKPVDNAFHVTHDAMQLSNTFIRDFLPVEVADKTEKSDLLKRSLDYFKENEVYDEVDFCNRVLDEKTNPEEFKNFKQSLGMEDDSYSRFEISKEAVQKQARLFKSVLKLDKNFHVYIHGDKRMIERGQDDSGRKYYKLFYENEF